MRWRVGRAKDLLIILALGEWMRVAWARDVRGKDVMMRRKEEMELPRRVRLLSALCFLEFRVRSGDIIHSFRVPQTRAYLSHYIFMETLPRRLPRRGGIQQEPRDSSISVLNLDL